jgi:hypothetical protein
LGKQKGHGNQDACSDKVKGDNNYYQFAADFHGYSFSKHFLQGAAKNPGTRPRATVCQINQPPGRPLYDQQKCGKAQFLFFPSLI